MTKTDLTLRVANGSPLTHAQQDANFQRLVYWSGLWDSQSDYTAQEMVRDGDWLAIANKGTSERPAPQPTDSPTYPYTGSNPQTSVSAKQVIQGMDYTLNQDIYITGYRIYGVAGNNYRVYSQSGSGEVESLIAFTASETGWVEFPITPRISRAGLKFRVYALTNEPDATPTIWSGNWNYQKPNNQTIPAAGDVVHSSKVLGVIRFAKTDDDGGDRSSELLALSAGDIVNGPGISWTILSVTDGAGFVDLGIAPASQGFPQGVFNFTFETVTATPIEYLKDVGTWTGNATIRGLEAIDADVGTITPDDNQYGVDIQYQPAIVSDDWDFLALSQSTGGGSSGGGNEAVFGYGEISTTSAAYPDITDVFSPLATWTPDPGSSFENCTMNASDGTFTVAVAGLWRLTLHLAIQHNSYALNQREFIVRVNNETDALGDALERTMGLAGTSEQLSAFESTIVRQFEASDIGKTFRLQWKTTSGNIISVPVVREGFQRMEYLGSFA
jgi:hypothetical protein